MDLTKSYDFFQPTKHDDRIHIIGCGSVGSTVAEMLARCGVTKFTLWDFDIVESRNIANQMFRHTDIGKPKVEALKDILVGINPDIENDIKLNPEGWNGNRLSGFIFMCVDSIDLRREIVKFLWNNPYVKAVFDFRTRLTDAQHYAADWTKMKEKENLLNSMEFTKEEAAEETPVSACGVELCVAPTVRTICSCGVANFINFWNKGEIKKMILADAFGFEVTAF